ncbi:MAG: hypothetical protein HYU63_02605 [Armatimonadetes bacterium]|nr:hypothetical protein [Armatimonadota bacterium]
MAKSAPLHIRLEPNLFETLKKMAKIENRTLNNFIENILSNYTEELELLINPEFQEGLKDIEKGRMVDWKKLRQDV